MKYRSLGKTGLQVSALAMGCMRLPADDPDLAAQLVDEAIAAGINYFETTRGYIDGRCHHREGRRAGCGCGRDGAGGRGLAGGPL